ncbi:hypothetical protein PHLGIDRAFT_128085 [Phlebiopsis gigantea 11061_1 CR5-6]|uniref:Uncharacterized protein n=1 Tax=Phlebiopsis gigantea (strain 11061_1 CR5-6) TaxID=745531 RepID=A0A0C3NNR7_PHLG1|nr:hypothetical protein PHLGIDRAFT_128085 [Phlebiopsis gigantea 11061_1 CR5-6]
MPPGPEILTLENFAEQHLDALLTATSKSAFDAALDALLAPTAKIVLNGASVSRAAYGAYLWKAQAHERSATVAFKGVVAVPKDSKAIVQTGEVGVFFVATISQPPLLFSEIVTASLNLVVEEVKDQHAGADVSGRRAVSLTQVSTERPSNFTPIGGQ